MKKKILGLLFIFTYFNSAFSQTVFKDYVDGRIYLKLTQASFKELVTENPTNIPLTTLRSFNKLFSKYGVTKVYKPFYQAFDDEILSSILKIEFTSVTQVNNLIDELTRISGVEYAEKVHFNKTDIVPNDPLFATSNGSTHLNQINAQNAWNVFNGNSNITVAIVDNAVMGTHADLLGNTYTNTIEATGTVNVDDDGNGYIDDINGYDVAALDGITTPTNTGQDHGTHCAGIAGANTNNSIGVASIGWNIKIIPVKASFDNSPANNVDFGYEGILYAVKAKAKIISCSWGNMGAFSQTEQYVIDYAWNRGCLIFASAGNASSTTPNYPGAYNHVYCVAAVDPFDVKSGYSNYGTWVDIAAPGDNILSTVPYTSGPATYIPKNGTSMATPMVAGLAALMLSKSPNMTRTDVLNCISSTAVNIYSLGGNSSYISGSQLGAGRIEAFAAMNCAATYSALPPVANFYAFLPNTCPNTAIPFFDSSLYVPTSWSWVFQGGTPATSTSSNPSVQWASTGTYSVSLTVGNTNGSNTKTKLSYITVAGPTALPFSEGFQTTPFLPSGWVANNIWNDNLYWQRKTGVGGYGTSTACAMFDNFNMNAPGERDEMRTPKFDFSAVATASLTFDVAYARYNATFSDSLEVKVSTNCGTSWTSVYLKGGTNLATTTDQSAQFVPNSSQWRTEAVNISTLTAGQNNIMFSFLNRGRYGQPIYVDNINLAFPTPTLISNSSASICVLPTTYTFTNTSLSATNYTWNFQGGSPAVLIASNPTVAYANPGTYTYTVSAVNGTATASLTKTITVVAPPLVSSSSNTYCSGVTYTLNGSGASTYTWLSTSGSLGNTPTLIITPIANSTYTLNGSNGVCSSQGLYNISIIASPTITAANQTLCSGSTATLAASGASTYSWSTGATSSSIQVTPVASTLYIVSASNLSCTTNKTVSITVIQLPVTVVSSSNAICSNSCNGFVSATTTNGNGPFTYSLNSGSCTTLPCTNLCEGVYLLQTTNSFGCSSSQVFSITAPAAMQSVITVTNAGCSTCLNGASSVIASGGIGPYTFTWLPSGGNAATATGLAPGCYTVNITDANSCATFTNSCVLIGTGLTTLSSTGSLRIYPNPAKANFTIEYLVGTFNYSVYNAIGQLIVSKKYNQHSATVQLSEFAKGIYVIEVETEKNILRKKLIVE